MRSVVIDETRTVRVVDAPEPELPDERGAMVRVTATAICGSDLHFFDGDIPVFGELAVGHEVVGEVVEVGSDVRTISTGDRVAVSSVAGCGRCAGCATKDAVRCERGFRIFGSGMLPGGQSEFLAVPDSDFQLLKLPESISEDAALLLTDNLATGWGGASRADIPPGGTVAVVGAGAVGQCAVRCAVALGAGRVFAIDRVAGRRELAEHYGADGIDPGNGDAAKQIKHLTNGHGVDSVVEAVGGDATITMALEMVRSGGTVSIIGVPGLNPFPLPVMDGLLRSMTIRMTTAPVQRAWDSVLPWIETGLMKTEGIITHAFALEDAGPAYAKAAERAGDCLKIKLRPDTAS